MTKNERSSQTRAYHKRWKHERAHGLTRTMDAAPVAEHITMLLAAHWSLRGIAEAAGCAVAIPHRINQGHQSRVRRDLGIRLLSVTPESIRTRGNRDGFVLNLGARRRIRAMLAMGHRHVDITEAMTTTEPTIGTTSQMVLHQKGEWIARRTHDAVLGAYNELSMRTGPSTKTARWAVKLHYAPPLAWDDIDDPNESPNLGEPEATDEEIDEVAVRRIIGGSPPTHVRLVDRQEATRQLHAAGMSDDEIGRLIGVTGSAVFYERKRKGVA